MSGGANAPQPETDTDPNPDVAVATTPLHMHTVRPVSVGEPRQELGGKPGLR